MSATTALFEPSLESVQQAFDHWRTTRQKRSRTPMSLRRRAAALCHAHPASHICQALRINDTALRQGVKELSPDSIATPSNRAALVELPREPTAPIAHPESAEYPVADIRIDIGDAMVLCVRGHFTLEQILIAAHNHQQAERR